RRDFPTARSRSSSTIVACRASFFFQAEDGIRDGHVTGVQTCALPISERWVRILRLQKSYPSFGASVKISVSKKEPQRCFVEVLDESASPLTTGVLRDGPLRDAGRFFFGERARDLYAYEGKPQGARMVPGREVRVVHSLGGVQRAGRRGMGNGNPAHQPHRLRKAPELLQSPQV